MVVRKQHLADSPGYVPLNNSHVPLLLLYNDLQNEKLFSFSAFKESELELLPLQQVLHFTPLIAALC